MKDKIYSQLLSRTEFGSHLFYSKSLYRSRAGNHFYGTKFKIWADFGLAGNTENKIGPKVFFLLCFHGQKISFIKEIADFETTYLWYGLKELSIVADKVVEGLGTI